MDLGLRGKVALITGVSYGIGAAAAETFIAEGAQVFGTSRGAPDRTDIGHLAVDMSEPDAGERAVAACVERFGRLDVLVNNVGSGKLGTGFASEDDETWQQFWNLNVMSMIRTSRAALPHLVSSGAGVIVNVSSVNGELPESGIYSYSAGKAAMNNITVNLAREYARRGVRVVGVAPGPVGTPLWLGPSGVAAQASALGAGEAEQIIRGAQSEVPIGRFATAEEIGDAIVFLASPRSGSTTGATVRIDGGITPTV